VGGKSPTQEPAARAQWKKLQEDLFLDAIFDDVRKLLASVMLWTLATQKHKALP
jgi:hypothetical protein